MIEIPPRVTWELSLPRVMKSSKELLDFYQETGPAMFDKQFILKRWHALYKSEPLKTELQKTFGV
ncbi:MAG: hypothetical protein PVG08_20265 [Desulfobacterales bacterium]|jgi:hypothetical protein